MNELVKTIGFTLDGLKATSTALAELLAKKTTLPTMQLARLAIEADDAVGAAGDRGRQGARAARATPGEPVERGTARRGNRLNGLRISRALRRWSPVLFNGPLQEAEAMYYGYGGYDPYDAIVKQQQDDIALRAVLTVFHEASHGHAMAQCCLGVERLEAMGAAPYSDKLGGARPMGWASATHEEEVLIAFAGLEAEKEYARRWELKAGRRIRPGLVPDVISGSDRTIADYALDVMTHDPDERRLFDASLQDQARLWVLAEWAEIERVADALASSPYKVLDFGAMHRLGICQARRRTAERPSIALTLCKATRERLASYAPASPTVPAHAHSRPAASARRRRVGSKHAHTLAKFAGPAGRQGSAASYAVGRAHEAAHVIAAHHVGLAVERVVARFDGGSMIPDPASFESAEPADLAFVALAGAAGGRESRRRGGDGPPWADALSARDQRILADALSDLGGDAAAHRRRIEAQAELFVFERWHDIAALADALRDARGGRMDRAAILAHLKLRPALHARR